VLLVIIFTRTSRCLSALSARLSSLLTAGLKRTAGGFSTFGSDLSLCLKSAYEVESIEAVNANLLVGIRTREPAGVASMTALACNLLDLKSQVSDVN
jgi:hypothetical protein